MTVIAASTIRTAREHLNRYGLRTDHSYGEPFGSCCTIGHVAVAWRAGTESLPYGEDIDFETASYQVENNVAAAWERWMCSQGQPVEETMDVATWNDYKASPDDVARFYDWWAADLTATGMGDATDAR